MQFMLSIQYKTVKIIVSTPSIKDFLSKIGRKDSESSGESIQFISEISAKTKTTPIKSQ